MPGEDSQALGADLGPPVAEIRELDAGPIFDPAPAREKARGFLALGVFFLLVLTVGFILVPIVVGHRTWSQMQGVTASVLPAVIGLTGTVLAFYFASEEKRK